MKLTGENFVGGNLSSAGTQMFRAYDPTRGVELAPEFHEATQVEIDQALEAAAGAFDEYRMREPSQRAAFLEAIAENIVKFGDELIERANAETALPCDRLVDERARTIYQLQMLAGLLREGSWVEASIDHAIPDRKPTPKPDIRRMLVPLGPVVVFGASNFPLAYSVAGGDTVSALAAGNPVVVKAHPAHPGTCELVAQAILRAVEESGMPMGVFSMVHGAGNEVGLALVRHPLTQAVGFTGSLRGGRALFDEAARRPQPIPVYAEMGSTNPVFVLPGALRARGEVIAAGLKQSVTQGVGQFCTCPGLVIGVQDSSFAKLKESLAELFRGVTPETMLHPGILRNYKQRLEELCDVPKVEIVQSVIAYDGKGVKATAAILSTDANTFCAHSTLSEEVFGPATVLVGCPSPNELQQIADGLGGNLTATIHGTPHDLIEFKSLISTLEKKVGRLIFNGFPTGLEVCPSIVHGGPYPATTDSRSTSVGTEAVKRFARPMCYQNFPPKELPPELQDDNPRRIWRLVDGQWGQ